MLTSSYERARKEAAHALRFKKNGALQRLLTSRDPYTCLGAMRAVFDCDPDFADQVAKLDKCNSRRRCESRFCPNCAIPPVERSDTIERVSKLATADSRSHDPRIRARQSVQYFYHFPQTEVWFVTVNFEALPCHKLRSRIDHWRKQLNKFLRSKLSNGVVEGRFEFAPMSAVDLRVEDLSSTMFQVDFHANDVALKLHIHMLVYAPALTQTEVSELFAREFGDGRITNVRPIRDRFSPKGANVLGVEGAAHYFAKEFTDLRSLK